MADQGYRRDGEEEEEEEDVDESGYKTVKDAVLFAIDVSESMAQSPPPSDDKKADHDSPMLAALKCAYQLVQQRIISNPTDMMGVILFGTEKSKFVDDEEDIRSGLAYPHCYLLTDLDVPAAADVKRLKEMVEDEETINEIMVPAKNRDQVSMANVLFCANQIFTTKAPNFSSRRLFLVTDNDNPHADDKTLRSASVVRAKDLYDLGVVIELFPIASPGGDFDRTKFYDDIVYRLSTSDPETLAPVSGAAKTSSSGDGITLLQSLLSSINSKAAPRRALFSLPLELGPGLRIGVKGYITVKRQEPVRSCYVWVAGEKPQIAIGNTSQIAEDTARTVEKTEIRKAYKFGGEIVSFTPDEVANLRNFGEPVIRIIGFKPIDMLPLWANLRSSVFIYPSESDFIGSTRVFSALHQKLLKDQKMAIAWYIARRNATPVLAAILPGEERHDESGGQTMPPGLWIIHLPFADDIRNNPETEIVPTTDQLTDSMRVIVQQLQLPKAIYDPKRYPNPSLQWFYRILQAIALEEDLPERAEDKTIPKYRQIDKRTGEYVLKWGEELEAEFKSRQISRHGGIGDSLTVKKPSAAKRRTESPGGGDETSKRAKMSSDAIGDDEMRSLFSKNAISKLTIPVLKQWASSKQIPIHGKKADIVENIESYFESK